MGGRVLEFGPQRLRMTGSLAALIQELGLDGEVLRAPPGLPLFVYSEGALREVPFSLGSLLRSDTLSWRGKLRLGLEPLTAGPRLDESVAALLTRKLGREAYERLAGPLYGGLYASDPADMVVGLSAAGLLRDLGIRRSLLARFARRNGGPPGTACSFGEGMQVLTDALHHAHAGSIRTNCPALGLAPSGGGWSVESGMGTVEAEKVVLTCDAGSAARILSDVSAEAARGLSSLVYNPLAVVHLEVPGSRLRGLGFQVALGTGTATRGVTWNYSLFGSPSREDLCTAFLGGATMARVLQEPDDRVGGIAAGEFEGIIGRPAGVLAVTRTSMPAWDRSWQATGDLRLPEGIIPAGSWHSRPGIPGRLLEARKIAVELTT